ncbi:YaaC family protein [Listeria booriae]|uniref:Uncharacterized protein n=1 Tax=Listeria booriae TaxID=1552123 RepID=A0A7X0XRY0_9LIST|nr:YaaC family protein [Listeria booriae]MBC1779583.1 hypothetical protein [Listeria booriae]MBC1887938.1 hypothetical protein [Listeria booriae]MBC2205296.1 hypothetical protein [Listeria booriae]MDT0110936.1 YaaC family protein [Listeria booriae]
MIRVIKINKRELTIKKSYGKPNFNGQSILASNPWEYVELWLKRNNKDNEALFYWQQAKQFYEATESLPLTAAPLTAYYCFLNATKTLLSVRNIPFNEQHGVTGRRKSGGSHLGNEIIRVQAKGVFPELCKYFGDFVPSKKEFILKDLLRNLVYIHRAYCLTYTSEKNKEIFIPINRIYFVQKKESNEAWCCIEIDEKYTGSVTERKLKKDFEKDPNFDKNFVVRSKSRFKWDGSKTMKDEKFIRYHKKIRKNLQYIAGTSSRWYIKRKDIDDSICLNSLSITFAAMHRLSELSRYNPLVLRKHLDSQQNWLLSEFINSAPYQFIHEIASEITGEEFLVPRRGL